MPVEIRELIIKTEVRSQLDGNHPHMNEEDISGLKEDILSACKRMIQEKSKKNQFKR